VLRDETLGLETCMLVPRGLADVTAKTDGAFDTVEPPFWVELRLDSSAFREWISFFGLPSIRAEEFFLVIFSSSISPLQFLFVKRRLPL
jgi:hypothetical protein